MNFQVLFQLLLGTIALGAPIEELVTDLPGLEYPVDYNQYSGYLNGLDGQHLHYWLTESQNNASSDPLILWLNGGPGCSSLVGLLTGNGPFRLSEHDIELLEPNPYAWNMIANMLYLETPACVGFSYDDQDICNTSDTEVAQSNYFALQHFFQKFPEYINRDFYITGESYAGIYIPTLSYLIVTNDSFSGNFKGYAIGNALLNVTTSDSSVVTFGYHYGRISEDIWLNVMTACCPGVPLGEERKCPFVNTESCFTAWDIALYKVYENNNLNFYNMYGECKISQNQGTPDYSPYYIDLQNLLRNKRLSNMTYGGPPCLDSSKETNYLNNSKVRETLHIPDHVAKWEACNSSVHRLHSKNVPSSLRYIDYLRQNGFHGLLYNGDVDLICNFLGNYWEVLSLELQPLEERRVWLLNGQIGGYFDRFEDLDFVTVRGAGHSVPSYKPAEALHLINAFINNEEY